MVTILRIFYIGRYGVIYYCTCDDPLVGILKTLRKEIVEITHAAGYEHPCQVTMGDVVMGMGDNHYTQSLRETYGYEKDPVYFEGMRSCDHLGANNPANMAGKLKR